MLRLISALFFVPTAVYAQACDSTYEIIISDSDPDANDSAVRVQYRSNAADEICTDTGMSEGQRYGATGKFCSSMMVSGFTCTETFVSGSITGLTISGGNAAGSIILPAGTLHVNALAMGGDALTLAGGKGTSADGVAQDAVLTGSFSDCTGDANAAGSISGSQVPGVTGESGLAGADTTGSTGSGGTWHAQDDDCHDILTGKRLSPEDIVLEGQATLSKGTGGTSFSLSFDFNDTYETTCINGVCCPSTAYSCTISNHNTLIGGGTAGTGAPSNAHAKDTDGRDLWFAGEISHDGGGSARAFLLLNGKETGVSFQSGASPIPVTATALERSKFSPVNNHYQWLVANCGSSGDAGYCNRAGGLTIEAGDVAFHRPTVLFRDDDTAWTDTTAAAADASGSGSSSQEVNAPNTYTGFAPDDNTFAGENSDEQTFSDTNGEVRKIRGDVKVIPPAHAMNLVAYDFHATANGVDEIGGGAQFHSTLGRTCPNYGADSDAHPAAWDHNAKKCGNSSPYSPRCTLGRDELAYHAHPIGPVSDQCHVGCSTVHVTVCLTKILRSESGPMLVGQAAVR